MEEQADKAFFVSFFCTLKRFSTLFSCWIEIVTEPDNGFLRIKGIFGYVGIRINLNEIAIVCIKINNF